MTALGAHVARHRRQSLNRRVLARISAARDARRQRRTGVILDDVRHDAFMVRVEPHAVPPTAKAQAALTALYNVLHHEHGFIVPPLSQPPAAVQPDEDVPGLEHLTGGQYSDDTLAFRRFVDGGQE